MSLVNASPYRALAVPTVAPDGHEVVVAIVKATFTRTAQGRAILADEPAPIRTEDVVYFPDARDSSIRYPSDVCVAKRGADIVVVGDAISPKPVPALDVAVAVGERRVPIRVHGERVFYKTIGGVGLSPAAPFERKPIVYERAWGGASADLGLIEARNPVGRGVAKDPRELDGMPAPQIEHPAKPITGAGKHEPVGLGAIGPAWSPRREYAGTFDAAWMERRMPLMPLDFDLRHNNAAHPSLQLEAPIAPGTPIAVIGMTLDGLWRTTLPAMPALIQGRFDDGSAVTERPGCDTLLLEPEAGRIEVTVRAAFRVGRARKLLREIRVDVDA